MDISVKIGDYKLNYRVSALIQKENKILVHKDKNDDHCTLPGGRIQVGENSQEALKREIKEEMGIDVELIRPFSLIENFFDMDGMQCQEFLIIYEAKLIDEKAYNLPKIEAIEEEKKGHLEFLWIEKEKLKSQNFMPVKLNEMIENDSGKFMHMINDERI